MVSQVKFPSKVLLYGEYGLLFGSDGLALPYRQYLGQLDTLNEETEEQYGVSHNSLESFSSYISNLTDAKLVELNLDRQKLALDREKKLYFKSNIPIGEGLGSSGALCAAFYDRYRLENQNLTYFNLKEIFSFMEGFFHGKSSGIDPLISYLNRPVLINQKKEIIPIDLTDILDNSEFQFFLFRSGISRCGGVIIEKFMDFLNCAERTKVIAPFVSLIHEAVKAVENKELKTIIQATHQISCLQLEFFKNLIAEEVGNLWEIGLRQNLFYMKLCGAGSGGHYLGLLKKSEIKKFEQILLNRKIKHQVSYLS